MSMQAWDVPTPTDNGPFNPTIDPSMAFANTPTSSNFDFSMQNAQIQRMQNGAMRNGNGSPAGFQNPMYQTTPVVPSKRPHEFTGSPRQASRSQTPQQTPYPGFAGAVNGQTPNPYQHLQQHTNSSNASPSPIMQSQQFNPTGMPQRMQTASPSPFSPATQNFGGQGSPVQSDYGNRVETPSNGTQGFMPGNPYANGMQSFTPPPGNIVPGYAANGMPGAFSLNSMTPEQQRSFDAKQQTLVRQLQANNMAAQQRHQMSNMNMPMNNPNQIAGLQAQAIRTQQALRAQKTQTNAVLRQPEQFANAVAQFMARSGQPFNKQPIIAARSFHCAQIFSIVMNMGGSRKITIENGWHQVARALHLHPNAAPELQNYWQQNLALYEPVFQSHIQQHQRQSMQQLQAMQGDANNVPNQFPAKNMNFSPDQVAAMQARRQTANQEFQTPVKGGLPPQDPRQVQMNGFSPSHENPNQHHVTPHPQTLQNAPSRPPQDPASAEGKKVLQPPHEKQPPAQRAEPASKTTWTKKFSNPIDAVFTPGSHSFQSSDAQKADSAGGMDTYGGIHIHSPSLTQSVLDATRARPDAPAVSDLGNIEIHALLMSLKSGIPGEVKLALDVLSLLIWEPMVYSGPQGPPHPSFPGHNSLVTLDECGDLLESLIDCAEVQLEALADHADTDKFSDNMQFQPYEELLRECTAEINTLQDVPEYGTLEYELEGATERLLCITAMIRNLSESSLSNRKAIADPVVVKFMATVIRYMGTRNMLLRTYRNTLDFHKDCITYLSNVANEITFSNKDEALWVLQFILSFAPSMHVSTLSNTDITFPSYEPRLHRYLPFAIQTLAKLLASGDPNRGFLKSIFAADTSSSTSPDLLTRAFALCIAPLPDLSDDVLLKLRSRTVFLSQGLLAADSLASLIPPSEHTLARSWLSSEDGFAHKLLRVIAKVAPFVQPEQLNHRHAVPQSWHELGYDMITSYGLSILRKLSERAKDSDSTLSGHNGSVTSKKNILLNILSTGTMEPKIVSQLNNYLSLDV
jgi:SWI/SNF chromatin-remodeling complex subunit SWI1